MSHIYDYVIEGPGLDDVLPRELRIVGMWVLNFDFDLVLAADPESQEERLLHLITDFQVIVPLPRPLTVRAAVPQILRGFAELNDETEHVPLFLSGFDIDVVAPPPTLRWWAKIDMNEKVNCVGLSDLLKLVEPPLA